MWCCVQTVAAVKSVAAFKTVAGFKAVAGVKTVACAGAGKLYENEDGAYGSNEQSGLSLKTVALS